MRSEFHIIDVHEPAQHHAWMDRAACLNADPEIFFSDHPAELETAKAICAGCPVLEQCRPLGEEAEYGVWAGEDKTYRRHVRVQTHCKKGHRFTPENTREHKRERGNYRACRTCERDAVNAKRQKIREEESAA